MKRLLSILLLLTLSLTACGEGTVSCPAEGNDPAGETGDSINTCTSKTGPDCSWSVTDDITISLEQPFYPVGTESFPVTFENTGSQVMLYGESYMFQRNDGSGWKDLKTIDNYGFNAIGYHLNPGDTQTLEVSPWMLTAPLAEGHYRIVGCTLRVANAEDQLGYDGDYIEYDPYMLEFDILEDAPVPASEEISTTGGDFYLEIQRPAPGDTDLPFTIVNNSGADAEILLIPTLEFMNEFGNWETVLFQDSIGFCGTPDPLPTGRKDWSEDLDYLWGDLSDGDYRLSFTVTDSSGKEHTASGQFTLDDGLCSLPLAE